MTAAGAFPFIEQDTLAHFIYRGGANKVNVPGDANGWNPDAFSMTRLSTTNFWYYSRVFESDARLDYKFVLNGSDWILDPRNPHQVSGGFGPNSELRMPAYVQPEEIEFNPAIPHGTLRDTTFFSTNLGNARTVRVYTPPFYQHASQRYPLILFHDGLDYVSLASANNVIDNLIAQNRIEPIMAVFVPAGPQRHEEYATTRQAQFTAFIVNELMPWVDRRYRTRNEPAARAVIGASDGGTISLWLGLTHPDVFGNIAAQSSNVETNVHSGFQNSPKLDLKLYLDLGTYDIPVLLPRVRNFIPVLQSKGYEFHYLEFHEGHSWGNWRAHIDNALEMFFPGMATGAEHNHSLPQEFQLLQNYPNPFNPTTNIRFSTSHGAIVVLQIYNTRGQLVQALLNQHLPVGTHSAVWDGRDVRGVPQPSGVYLYQLIVDGRVVDTKKLILLK
jgi:enterochelin esterase family protein